MVCFQKSFYNIRVLSIYVKAKKKEINLNRIFDRFENLVTIDYLIFYIYSFDFGCMDILSRFVELAHVLFKCFKIFMYSTLTKKDSYSILSAIFKVSLIMYQENYISPRDIIICIIQYYILSD